MSKLVSIDVFYNLPGLGLHELRFNFTGDKHCAVLIDFESGNERIASDLIELAETVRRIDVSFPDGAA